MDLVEELSVKRIDGVTDSTLGTNLGRHLVCLAETVPCLGLGSRPRSDLSVCVCVCVGGCDGLPSLESVESHADTTQHTAEPY